ncbi:ATPase WRNIP1 [Neltuma alba]|uniref:ATPase WRNIP1 n=1 Tax=Neltuma alba TaxID=207710 RepID=UPI0010A36485|nr:ATPase WRNIP1 [Prosopis alba]XP_028796024.1 ATPase WRNIP1 [Prosopis alba]
MEMQQLLSMGFPDELAAQALAATGGKSTIEATEWIFNHKATSSNHVSNSNPPPVQPKLDRFFNFQSKLSSAVTASSQACQQEEQEDADLDLEESAPNVNPSSKRLKLSPSNTKPASPVFLNHFRGHKSANNVSNAKSHEPLYERMRPRTIDDVIGQDHLVASNSLLRSAIECGRLPSIIFWGPPGTGKTSIAKAIVNSATSSQKQQCPSYRFVSLSAVTSGVKDVRDAVDEARKLRVKCKQRTVLFVDEVHRFNKSQQDSFLPVIEDGSIVFVGATTENPSFHLITPLLSRCRVLTLNPLKPHHVVMILKGAVNNLDKGLVQSIGFQVDVVEDVISFIANNCDGDARVALNALEIAAVTAAARSQDDKKSKDVKETEDMDGLMSQKNRVGPSYNIVTLDDAKEALQCKHLAYDKAGEEHYNLISALHKSMRGSDANAAIYWLARMLEGGEEPLYIARRLIRFASEDIGLADPSALNQAVSCYQACHFLGMPECNVILAQCVAYLALAPKSIAVYRAIEAAQKVVKESIGQNEGVPLHLRNAPSKLMEELGYAKGYIYTPDNPTLAQNYLPPSLNGYMFLDWPDKNTSDGQKSSKQCWQLS